MASTSTGPLGGVCHLESRSNTDGFISNNWHSSVFSAYLHILVLASLAVDAVYLRVQADDLNGLAYCDKNNITMNEEKSCPWEPNTEQVH